MCYSSRGHKESDRTEWLTLSQTNTVDETKLCSPIHSTFEVLVVQHAIGCVVGKNWALSIDRCQLQALQFSVYLIDLLSILLRYSGFTETQKAVVDQTGSRPPNSDHDLVFGMNLAFGSSLELLSPKTELVITGYHI